MSYFLKTYTKGEYKITDEQELKLRSMSSGDKIYLKDGSTIMVNNIAEITKIKTDSEYRQLEAPKRVVYNKQQLINALTQMIKGYKNYFGDRKLPPQSQVFLNHMEMKLEQAQRASDKKTFSNPVWEAYH